MEIFPKKVELVQFDAPFFIGAARDVANVDTLSFWIDAWAHGLRSPMQGTVHIDQLQKIASRHDLASLGDPGALCMKKWYPLENGFVFNKTLCDMTMRGHNKAVIERFFEEGAALAEITLFERDENPEGIFAFKQRTLPASSNSRVLIAAPFGPEFEILQESLGQGRPLYSEGESLATRREKPLAPTPETLIHLKPQIADKKPVGIMEFRSIMGMNGRNSIQQINQQYVELSKCIKDGFTKELLLAAYEIAFAEKAEHVSLGYVCAILRRASQAAGQAQYLPWVDKDHLKAICGFRSDVSGPLQAIMLTALTSGSQEYVSRKLLETLEEPPKIKNQIVDLLIKDFQIQEAEVSGDCLVGQGVDLLERW